MTNKTSRDIDDIRGGFVVEDRAGETVFSSGQTEAVPGAVFLASGQSREMAPFGLNRREKLMAILRTRPEELKFFFEARSITYMDGSKESRLEP
jgi:hypothetical protein